MAATAFAASPLAGVKLATRSAVAMRRTARAAPVRAAADTATATASIGETFAALKRRNQCAFVPFICAGDPNLDATEKALAILDEAGADVIELGVPYSDPLADGPTIQVRRTRPANDARLESSRRGAVGDALHASRATRIHEPPYRHRIAVRLLRVRVETLQQPGNNLRRKKVSRDDSAPPLTFSFIVTPAVHVRCTSLDLPPPHTFHRRRPPRRARSPAARRFRR